MSQHRQSPGSSQLHPSIQDFRDEVHGWLQGHWPERDQTTDDDRLDIISRTPDGHQAFVDAAREFQRSLAAARLVGITLPVEYGGRGLSSAHQGVLDDELARFDTPSRRPLSIGQSLVAPTILRYGTEKQKATHLPDLLRGVTHWCQLFSEPDAGSDLASLRTTAIRDGDVWRVTGQKVWSSYAADADWGILLARTDPDAPRPQSGITMFVLDMHSPGVSVRPLTDIAGGHHFNEVFLTDVLIPEHHVLGPVNEGWTVANSTLGGERAGYRGGSGEGRRQRQAAVSAGTALVDPMARDAVARIAVAERVLELLAVRVESGTVAAGHPAAGSLLKLAAGNLEQASAELNVNLSGMSGVAWEACNRDGDRLAHALSASRQATIAGGTHQIQRNLVAERILGLPREPRR